MLTAALLALLLAQSPDDATETAELVLGLAARGLHTEVEREARGFLERWPRHGRADEMRYRLGAALEEEGSADEAVRWLAPLAESSHFAFWREASFRLGRARLAQGDAREAARALEGLLARDAGYLEDETRLAAARARLATGEARRARELLEPIVSAASAGGSGARADALAGEALVLAAWAALRTDEAALARVLVARSRRCAETTARAALMAQVDAEAALALGRPDEALASIDALPAGERLAAHERARAFALSALGRQDQARAAFRRALSLGPEPALASELALALASESLLAGDPRAALEALAARPAGGAPADEAACRLVAARAHAALGDARAALAELERARSLEPNGPSAAEREALRGDLLWQLGEKSGAAEAWLAAGGSRARLNAAAVELAAGRAERALELAQSVAKEERDPELSREAARLVGEAWLALGQPSRAAPSLATALEGTPPEEARALRTRLAWARYQAGEREAAAADFAALARETRGPEAAEAAYLAGRALAELGRGAEAVPWLERALAVSGENADEARLLLASLVPGPDGERHLEALARGGGPLAPRAELELGARRLADGRFDEAASLYEAAWRAPEGALEPALALAAGHGLAFARWRAGNASEACAVAARLWSAGAGASESAAAIAELWLAAAADAGDPEAAARAVGALAEVAPPERLLDAALAAARTLAERGASAQAERLLASLERGARGNARARILAERAWLALDAAGSAPAERLARALALLEEALRLASDEESVLEVAYFAAEAARGAGDTARAAALYARAAGLERIAAHARLGQGLCELAQGQDERAARTLGALLAANPERALAVDARYARAEALGRLGREEERAAELERLLADAPPALLRDAARLELGEARLALGRPAEALRPLDALLREAPDFEGRAQAELLRGEALAATGDLRGARVALERVIGAEGGSLRARARLALARVSRAEGRDEAALAELLKVAVLHEGEEALDALVEAGEILAEQGELEAARARWREVLERGAGTPQAEAARARLAAPGGAEEKLGGAPGRADGKRNGGGRER